MKSRHSIQGRDSALRCPDAAARRPYHRFAFWAILAFIILHSAFSLRVCGQSYSIDWFTIDGGGGTSTGGVFSVTGTIGQPDAGTMSGGNYSIDGGFWGIISVVQTPGAPLLTILRTSTNAVVLSWSSPSSFKLQINTDVGTTNWSDVGGSPFDDGTNKTVIVSPPTGNHFYRLFKP